MLSNAMKLAKIRITNHTNLLINKRATRENDEKLCTVGMHTQDT
jgi:hypothetical protein